MSSRSDFRMKSSGKDESGHSLVEVLIVVALIGIAVALVVSRAGRSPQTVGGAERVLRELRERLEERRAAAIRLQPLPSSTSLEAYSLPPVEIDFTNLSTTVPVAVDSTTVNGSSWSYVYAGDALMLPQGWQVVATPAGNTRLAASIPLIANGSGGRGVLATRLRFDGEGLPQAWDGTAWETLPAGSPAGGSAELSNAPFWALYAVSGDQKAAVALAIHPGGVFEEWRWSGSVWEGFRQRALN